MVCTLNCTDRINRHVLELVIDCLSQSPSVYNDLLYDYHNAFDQRIFLAIFIYSIGKLSVYVTLFLRIYYALSQSVFEYNDKTYWRICCLIEIYTLLIGIMLVGIVLNIKLIILTILPIWMIFDMCYCILLSYMLISKLKHVHYWFSSLQLRQFRSSTTLNLHISSYTGDEQMTPATAPIPIPVATPSNGGAIKPPSQITPHKQAATSDNKPQMADTLEDRMEEKQEKKENQSSKKQSTTESRSARTSFTITQTSINTTSQMSNSHIENGGGGSRKDLSNLPHIVKKTTSLATAVFISTLVTFTAMIGSLIMHFFVQIENDMIVALICGIPYLFIGFDSAINAMSTILYFDVVNDLYNCMCCICICIVKICQK